MKRRIWCGAKKNVFAAVALAAFLTFGCAASNVPKAGKLNFTITTVIADAGTIAISAEQQYQAGQIPQNEYTRKVINDLGLAYNDAKQFYSLYLGAYAEYGTAQQKQIQACTPAGAGTTQTTDACTAATAASTAAQTKLSTSQVNLDSSVSALTTKTNAVKAITKK
jgi:hypothetical protein